MENNKIEKFSYSKLSTYEQCPYKYKLIYVDGNFVNEPSIATDIGTLIHSTEEAIYNQIKDNLFGVFVDYNSLIENIKLKFKEFKEKYPDQINEKDKSGRTYSDKINSYISSGIYRLENYLKNNPNLELLEAEKEFNITVGSYTFHGFIDRLFYDKVKKQVIIEDIKTYAIPLEHKDLTTPLQFVFYTLAVQEMYKTDNIVCAYDLPFCDMKQSAGTSGYVSRGKNKILELLELIDTKEFEPKPCPLCHWCVFSQTYINGQPEKAKYLCPYFCHWTKTKKDFSTEYEWMGTENDSKILESFRNKANKQSVNINIEDKIEITNSDTKRRFLFRI